MRHRTTFIAILLVIAAVGIGIAVFVRQRDAAPPTPPPEPAFEPVANPEPAADPHPDAPPAEAEPPTAEEVKEETAMAPREPYFPPLSWGLTGSRLGKQRVPGTADIGDIYQIIFHDPTQALFMAVREPDGLRSIWRLDQHGNVERIFIADRNPGEIRIVKDSKGVFYVMHNNPGRIYRTDDVFVTWRLVLEGTDMFWNIADDGMGTVYGSLHSRNEPILYRSLDDGLTWAPWIDFHKVFPEEAVPYSEGDTRFRLRHLHDVIYNRTSELLIVGMGDVARFAAQSGDGGKTWQKIWNEGFTAHTVVGGNRYLLCPDRLRSVGIVLYDIWGKTVKEVWHPAPYNYAGYCYSIVNVDGIFYAALHTEANEVGEVVPKFGIIASPDAETWYPFLEWGPLTNHARTDIWLAGAPGRVYVSLNGALYAFHPLGKDWFAFAKPFAK